MNTSNLKVEEPEPQGNSKRKDIHKFTFNTTKSVTIIKNERCSQPALATAKLTKEGSSPHFRSTAGGDKAFSWKKQDQEEVGTPSSFSGKKPTPDATIDRDESPHYEAKTATSSRSVGVSKAFKEDTYYKLSEESSRQSQGGSKAKYAAINTMLSNQKYSKLLNEASFEEDAKSDAKRSKPPQPSQEEMSKDEDWYRELIKNQSIKGNETKTDKGWFCGLCTIRKTTAK